jgi:chromosome segregation ATPase
MPTKEELRNMGLMEFIHSKGHLLSGYLREYQAVERDIEKTNQETKLKEREYDNLYSELHSLKEQVQSSEKYIAEVKASKASLTLSLEQMSNHRVTITQQEAENKAAIEKFRSQFDDIKSQLAAGPEWTSEQLEMKMTIEKERDYLQSKYENQMLSVMTIRNEIDTLYSHIQNLEEQIANVEKETEAVDEKLKEVNKQTKLQCKQLDSLEKQVFSKRDEIRVLEEEINERKRLLKFEEKSLHDLEAGLKDIRRRMEESIADYNKLYHSLETNTFDLERQKVQITKLQEEIKQKEEYNALKREECDYYVKECKKFEALREVLQKKIAETEQERQVAEEEQEKLSKEIHARNNMELTAIHKERESMEKMILGYKKQLDLIRRKTSFQSKSAKSLDDIIESYQENIRSMATDLQIHQQNLQEYDQTIETLNMEKEKYDVDIEAVSKEYYTALEELKLQDIQIRELQKKIQEDNLKLRHKQNSYESMRSDRNLFSKQLMDSQAAMSELKKTFRTISYTIEQLKDEISIKDHEIVKEHFLHHAVDKERELLRNELIKINKQIATSDTIIENQTTEILKLNRIIEEAHQEYNRQQKEFQHIRNEKNVLTSQIMKRNAEIANTYDMIKMQRSNLSLGEKRYFDVTIEIDKYKLELRNLIMKNNQTIEDLKQLSQMKHDQVQLEKQILQEQVKTSMLERELEKPINVHRWRILEASDPEKFEKITQVHALQKELIAKSDQLVDIELLIQEKEKVYLELKKILARQPGEETEEQLLVYQQTYKDKCKQLQALDDELSMYREQIRIFKDEIQDFDDKIESMKKEWVQRKLKEERFAASANQFENQ